MQINLRKIAARPASGFRARPQAPTRTAPADRFAPSQARVEGLYSPGDLQRSPVERALDRMLRGPVEPTHRATMAEALEPYGGALLNRLADNGLTIVVPKDGFAHYSIEKKQITLPHGDLEKDTEVVPFREYMIVHEMAHALDYLFEPEKGPLSERADLGIDRHRGRLNALYQPVLQRFNEIQRDRQARGEWGRSPNFPLARVYGEDFMTVVEKVTGQSLAERPARGHLSILSPSTRPTEYFADAVYTYLHGEPVSRHRYTLPDGQPIVHSYPPTRADMATRDPRMFEALERFFGSDSPAAENLRVE